MDVSLVSRASSSERSFVKSTFCVYVDRSASGDGKMRQLAASSKWKLELAA